MAELFLNMDEDWDLQAIVRGFSNDHYTATSRFDDHPVISSFGPLNFQNHGDEDVDDLFGFAKTFDGTNNSASTGNELHDLYKPFYPMLDSFSPREMQITPSNSVPEAVKSKPEEMKVVQKQNIPHQSAGIISSPKDIAHTVRYKRKKDQKRVVVQACGEGHSSDLWAWRKYGQKPIKGSPHPRSYYRCSSLKGCLARKQVEQSNSDPGMFIITYSAEHSHSPPTRRSSLAGTNRQKFSSVLKRTSSGDSCVTSSAKEQSSSTTCSPTPSSDVVAVSPTSSHLMQKQALIRNNNNDDEQMAPEMSNEENQIVVANQMSITDDFFVGLEDLDALVSNSAIYNCSRQQFR